MARTNETPDGYVRVDELDALVAKKVDEATQAMLSLLADRPSAAPDASFANALATSIAQLNDQGVGLKKRVAPEVMAARERATTRMNAEIAAAAEAGDKPQYELRHKVYLDDQLIDPMAKHRPETPAVPTQIAWPGVPNLAMRPKNEAARGIFEAFKESIGAVIPDDEGRGQARVTARGLVVMDDGLLEPRRQYKNVGTGDAARTGLQVIGRGSQAYTEHNILGTIHAPARQAV